MSTIIAPAAVDAVRNAFPFTVDKFPLSGPDGMRTPHYGLFRSDSSQCVGDAVSSVYEPHTVDDVCALVEASSQAFTMGDCSANCLFRDGHFVTVAPSKEYRQSVFGMTDNIWPRMVIRAGYDGRAFRATLGYYRDACRNMSVIRSAGRSVHGIIRHTAQLRDRMPELVETFQQLAAGWDGVVETARAMEARQINLADFIREVYPQNENASSRTRNSAEARVEKIIMRIWRERQATARPNSGVGRNFMVSAWEAYNGIQGYVQHDQRRRGNPSPIERAAIALDDASVARAMELALAV